MKAHMSEPQKTDSAKPAPSTRTTSVDYSQAPFADAQSVTRIAGANGRHGIPLTPAAMLQLQRAIGNQATTALLKSQFTGSGPSNRLQRQVETFQATADKVMYFSTYGRALNESDNPLFETREEAQEYDDRMKIQWELLQKGLSTSTIREMPLSDPTKAPDSMSPSETSTTKTPEKSVGSPTKTPTQAPERVPISQGLIHGTYIRSTNSVDLHVSSKGEGDGLSIFDMLLVSQTLYRLMRERSQETGAPKGTFVLHPTGAAIVKIVVQTLGEALGRAAGIRRARELVAQRKIWEKLQFWKTKTMAADKLDPSVIAEHVAYLQSIAALDGVEIVPILAASITKATTPEEFTQNMLENSEAGRTRMRQYEETLRAQEVGVSLDVSLTEDQLPQIIALLSTHAAPK